MISLRKKVLIFVLCLVAVLLSVIGFTVIQVVRYSYIQNDQKADAIIVLGAAEYAGKPSPVFAARLDHAYDLYKNGTAGVIITTGGSQPGEPYSEGTAGKKYLEKKGVLAEAVFADVDSDNTKQNLMRAKEIADAQNLHSFILVSDPFHMYRSKITAEDLGMSVTTSPTRTSPIAKNFWLNLEYISRETGLSLLHILFDV